MTKSGNSEGVFGFQNTHWSLILAANQSDSTQAHQALSTLCETYWYPIYAYIRCRGNDADSAKDLTQEFFLRFLDKEFLEVVDQKKGRFRNFLLSCVKHFLSNEYKKRNTLKVGGQFSFVPLLETTAEDLYQAEPSAGMTPDKLLDRRWALTVLERSYVQLKEDHEKSGKLDQFEVLQAHLSGAKEAPCSYAESAAKLGLNEAAARKAAERMRLRFGAFLRTNLAQTVSNPDELEAELKYLIEILSQPGEGDQFGGK